MKSSRCLHYLLAAIVLVVVAQVTAAEVLEDSGHPMTGVNPRRNYQSTRPVLCSRPPGRSQVLNLKWTFQPTPGNYVYNPDGVTIDAEGNVYIMVLDASDYQFVKFNGTDGTIIKTFNLAESIGYSRPTLVKGNKMYFGTQQNTYILNTTDLSIGTGIPNDQGGSVPNLQLSYAPYLGTHMVASNEATSALATTDILTYIRVSDQTVDSTQYNTVAGGPLPVLIYKDQSNEFPIVVSTSGSTGDKVVHLNSPNYSINVTTIAPPGEIAYRAWIEEDRLYIFTKSVNNVNVINLYNFQAFTGTLNSVQTVSAKFQGVNMALQTDLYATKNISVAQIYNTVTLKKHVVDLINDRDWFPQVDQKRLHSSPVFSIPDNTMMMQVSSPGGPAELIGFDLDTLEINTRGVFPTVFSDYTMGPAMIGENCYMYTSLNGRYFYAFAPIPILEIVPIFECVNQDGVAYFSYENLGDLDAVIPQLFDRNNLSPLNVTPGTDFGANRRGKYFPLSFRVDFGTTGTFTWQLEDYVLTVTLNASLRCPQTVRFNIVLTADGSFPSSFSESVRVLFATLAGINETRVSFAPKKRSVEQSATDLELELQVAPADPQSSEPKPEEAIQNFVENQLDTFNDQLGALPDAPANVTTKDVDGVPLETQILGVIPPPPAPITANVPVMQPVTNPPLNTPITSLSVIINVPIIVLILCFFIAVTHP